MKIACLIFVLLSSCTIIQPRDLKKVESAKYLNLQGLGHLKAKNLQEAKANFSLAYELSPNSESLDGLGSCYFYLKQYSEAQNYFIRAYQEDEKYYNSLINLALLYELVGYQDLAEQIYQQLIQKYPENYKLQNNFSAFIFDNYKNHSKQIVTFRLLQAKSLNPESKILRNLKTVNEYEN